MAQSVPMIGLHSEELPWIRLLVSLLRHPDPHVPELARQALLYLSNASDPALPPQQEPRQAF